MLIRYIGRKPRKDDNVAETGLVWDAEHPVHAVDDPVKAAKLLAYPLIWAEDAGTVGTAGGENAGDTEGEGAKDEDTKPKTTDLASLELEALREEAKKRGLNVHHKAGADKIRAAIEAHDAAKA